MKGKGTCWECRRRRRREARKAMALAQQSDKATIDDADAAEGGSKATSHDHFISTPAPDNPPEIAPDTARNEDQVVIEIIDLTGASDVPRSLRRKARQ